MRTTALFFAAAALAAAAQPKTYTGTISDDMCGADHKAMGGASAEKCARDCVKGMGSKYVLAEGSKIYILSDQKTPEKFAGKKVKVEGTLDEKTKTLNVKSIAAAQ